MRLLRAGGGDAGGRPAAPAPRLAALAALALGTAFRLNALPAALPLLAWIGWRLFPGARWRAAGAALALVAAVQGGAWLLTRAPGASAPPVWPVVAGPACRFNV